MTPDEEDRNKKMLEMILSGVSMLLHIEAQAERAKVSPDENKLKTIEAFHDREDELLGEDFRMYPPHNGEDEG